MTIIRQKKTANQCGQWSSFLEKKPRSSMLTFFFHLLKVYGELTFQSAPPMLLAGEKIVQMNQEKDPGYS